jgi:hypothetical protein
MTLRDLIKLVMAIYLATIASYHSYEERVKSFLPYKEMNNLFVDFNKAAGYPSAA